MIRSRPRRRQRQPPERVVSRNAREFRLLGWFLVTIAVLAILVPVAFGRYDRVFLGHLLGWLLLGGAVGHLAVAERSRGAPTVVLFNLVLGVVYLLLGVVFLVDPIVAIGRFRQVLIGFFFFHGLTVVSFGLRLRGVRHWRAVVAGGAFSMLLAVLVLLRVFPPWPTGELLFGLSLGALGVALLLVANGTTRRRRVDRIDPWR